MIRQMRPSAQFLPMLPDPVLKRLWAQSQPEIAALITYAPEEQLRTALLAQAYRLAAESGLDTYPEVTDALATPATASIDDESPLGRRLRLVAAEATAAFESRREATTQSALTEPERQAWMNRARAGEAIVVLLSAPPRKAAPSLLLARLDPHWRAQFADDLGPVSLPPNAVPDLIRNEQEAAGRGLGRSLGRLILRPGS
jgi:hypothetical protein